MVYDIIREYPGIGSFFYGHWEDFELSAEGFLIVFLGILAVILLTCLCAIAGYVLQTIALTKIAKQQGAWRNIRIMACLPFTRYFAIGKLAERSDAMQQIDSKRRLWGRILLITCCVAVPILIATLVLSVICLPGTQLFAMVVDNIGGGIGSSNSKLVDALVLALYVLLILIYLPAILVNIIDYDLLPFLMIVLPFVGLASLLVGMALLVLIRTLCGICYYKVLRTHFESKTALILTVVGAVTGLSPIVLFVASVKKRSN